MCSLMHPSTFSAARSRRRCETAAVPQDTAYVAALIDRLRACYLARTPLPTSAAAQLTAVGFYRFYRYVVAESYGQAEAGQKRKMARAVASAKGQSGRGEAERRCCERGCIHTARPGEARLGTTAQFLERSTA